MNRKLISRPAYLKRIAPYMKRNIIKVITGQRRVGKSFLLRLLQEEIRAHDPRANIISINKELNEFEGIRSDKDLFMYIEKRFKKTERNCIFIDEVQDIPLFEKTLRHYQAESKADIYISGSNARLLSTELATLLAGRYIEFRVAPLSFSEFLEFHQLSATEHSLYRFLQFGGLPYLIHLEPAEEIIFPYLRSIYDSVLLKDVVARYGVRNVDFLNRLSAFLAENTGSLITAKNISDYLKSQRTIIPTNTVISYLHYMCSVLFINKVPRMEISGKKIFLLNDKYYFEDVGLRNCIVGFRQADIAMILENAVYNHLRYLGYTVYIGKIGNAEIDFVAQKGGHTCYFQVCYLLSTQKIMDREYGNLLMIGDNYPKYVVSMDKPSGGNLKGVKHMHMLDFLLGDAY